MSTTEAIQILINNYSIAGANLLDWLDEEDIAAMPNKYASEQQWRDWGNDVACRATFRALRQAKDAVATKSDTTTDSMAKPVMSYRGWQIEEDRSCLDVNSTWRAFAPDYDPEVRKFNTWAAARTYKVLTAEIDLAIEEQNA